MSKENIKIGHTRAFNVNQNIMSIFFDGLLFREIESQITTAQVPEIFSLFEPITTLYFYLKL